jgi:hypothetical protein
MSQTNAHLLSNVVNCLTSILTDKLLNSCNSFRSCVACGSPCVFIIVNRCATGLELGMPLKYLHTTQDLVPKGLFSQSLWGSPQHFPQDWHKTWCRLAVPFTDPAPQVKYTTPNKHVWKVPTSTQLRATWHTDTLDTVVLPSLRYQNCCINGGNSPEYFRYHHVCTAIGTCHTLRLTGSWPGLERTRPVQLPVT